MFGVTCLISKLISTSKGTNSLRREESQLTFISESKHRQDYRAGDVMQSAQIFITNTPEDPIQNTATSEAGICTLSQFRKARPVGTEMESSTPSGVRKQMGQTWGHNVAF